MHKQDFQPFILIATSSFDKVVVQPVIDQLQSKGYKTLLYEADKVANGETPLLVKVERDGLSVQYDNCEFKPQDIVAAWYRRPNDFGEEQPDKGKQVSLDRERKSMQDGVWHTLNHGVWLNEPTLMHKAQVKLWQLTLAQAAGFNIPKTVTTNSWLSIMDLLPEQIIMKMQWGTCYVSNREQVLYTTKLTNKFESLPLTSLPFPGIFQPLLAKKREWRITVVDDKVFSAAIYTTSEAADDWRKHQGSSAVTFKDEKPSAAVQKLCVKLLHQFGLRYGAFDLIEEENGTITFLEVNPNGQYMWLETTLGLQISNAIADVLTTIAERNLSRHNAVIDRG